MQFLFSSRYLEICLSLLREFPPLCGILKLTLIEREWETNRNEQQPPYELFWNKWTHCGWSGLRLSTQNTQMVQHLFAATMRIGAQIFRWLKTKNDWDPFACHSVCPAPTDVQGWLPEVRRSFFGGSFEGFSWNFSLPASLPAKFFFRFSSVNFASRLENVDNYNYSSRSENHTRCHLAEEIISSFIWKTKWTNSLNKFTLWSAVC